jgi:hypothetical protein
MFFSFFFLVLSRMLPFTGLVFMLSLSLLCSFCPFTDVLPEILRSLTRKVWMFTEGKERNETGFCSGPN